MSIQSQNYDDAFGKYVSMFETLKELYEITDVTTYDFANPKQLSKEEIITLKREKEEK